MIGCVLRVLKKFLKEHHDRDNGDGNGTKRWAWRDGSESQSRKGSQMNRRVSRKLCGVLSSSSWGLLEVN